MSLAALREQAAEALKQQEALLQGAIDENRDMTDEENDEFAKLEERSNRLASQIKKLEELNDRHVSFEDNTQFVRRATVPAQPAEGDGMNGFKDEAEFATAVHAASLGVSTDERLTAPSSYHSNDAGDAGFLVPTAIRDKIWEVVEAEENLLNEIEIEPTSSNSVEMDVDPSTSYGTTGIQAYWRAEAEQMKGSKIESEGRTTKLHELYAFATMTEELLEDAPRLRNRITVGAGKAINFKASDSIVYGSGVGQPLGYLNSGALVTVQKEAGQAPDTVVADNILNMYYRMMPASIGRSSWRINADIMPQIHNLKIGDQPIWTAPDQGMQNAPGGFLLGRPIILTEHASVIGDKGDIQFIDPKGYYGLRKQSGIKFDESIHMYFDRGLRAFRFTFRFGGQPFLSKPVERSKEGSNARSHFITLEERA